jgi:26S proteasome regulatory subunit N6
VNALLQHKSAAKYTQLRDIESMRAIARAHQSRDLAKFEQTLRDYRGMFPRTALHVIGRT